MRTGCQRIPRIGTQAVRVTLLLLSIALCLPLLACGTSGGGAPASLKEPPAEEVSPKPFVGREARDAAELDDFVDQAQERAKERQSKGKGTEEGELVTAAAKDFDEANEAYRAGEYERAQQLYEQIVETAPLHYGANVNLALALLQQEKGEEALVQALACVALFPSDGAIPLNVQTAAVACGFSATDALAAARDMGDSPSKGDDHEYETRYNDLWDRIETELWPVAQGEGSAIIGRMRFEMLRDELASELGDHLGDDPDAQALVAYLDAVGKQLGYDDALAEGGEGAKTTDDAKIQVDEADEPTDDKGKPDDDADTSPAKEDDGKASEDKATTGTAASGSSADEDADIIDPATLEPHVGLPYLVTENDRCTIVFTGYHMSSEHPVAEFTFINNADYAIRFTHKGSVTANGIDVNDFSAAWPALEPSETGWIFGTFFNKDGDDLSRAVEGELESLLCSIEVKRRDSFGKQPPENTFPISWKAGDKKEQECDETVIDEEGVCKLRVSGLLGPSDGLISLRYDVFNRADVTLTIDSEHDWKIDGKDAELLNVDQVETSSSGRDRHLIVRANDGDAVGDAVKTVSGTLVIRDEDGKELTRKKLDLTF